MSAFVKAGRTFGWSLFSPVQVSTLATLPYDLFFATEHFLLLNVHHQLLIALLMSLFGNNDAAVHFGYCRKTFFVSCFGKGRVKLECLFMFTGCSLFQVFQCVADDACRIGCGVADSASFEKFKHAFGMHALLFGRFLKNGCNLYIALSLCCFGKECITHVGLRFSGE